MLGDSLTDGRGSTTNLNNRWPDQLLKRLQTEEGSAGVAILNQAAGGNRVLHDGLGPNALARLDRDVLAQSGVAWLLVFEGVNDIGTAEPTEAAQKQVTADLIAAYEQIVVRAHAQGIRVYGATLTPFGATPGTTTRPGTGRPPDRRSTGGSARAAASTPSSTSTGRPVTPATGPSADRDRRRRPPPPQSGRLPPPRRRRPRATLPTPAESGDFGLE